MKVFGQGAVNIGGHKISYGLLAAAAGIVGAVLIFLQMRNAGSSIGAGTGVGYTDAQGNTYDANGNLISGPAFSGASASGADWQSAFSALSSQIAALSGGTTANQSITQPRSPANVAASAGYANYATQLGNTGVRVGHGGADPAPKSPVQTAFQKIAKKYPVKYGVPDEVGAIGSLSAYSNAFNPTQGRTSGNLAYG